jgi:uncharacterized Zn finger protein
MPRESAEAKGRRYLTDGRLIITRVDETGVTATCRGMGEVYNVSYRRGGWMCECPARGRCAHLVALMLVTVAPPRLNGCRMSARLTDHPPARYPRDSRSDLSA